MAKLLKLGLKHEYHQDNTYYQRRRIPTDLLDWYRAQGIASGFVQRTMGTSDPKIARANWTRVQAEIEAEWARVREHLRTANAPQTLDQIDEATAKALVWKCWLAWQALGFSSTRPIDDFGGWALRVLEKLPAGIEYMTPRAVKEWHDDLDRRPQLRILSQFAQNAFAREVPVGDGRNLTAGLRMAEPFQRLTVGNCLGDMSFNGSLHGLHFGEDVWRANLVQQFPHSRRAKPRLFVPVLPFGDL